MEETVEKCTDGYNYRFDLDKKSLDFGGEMTYDLDIKKENND